MRRAYQLTLKPLGKKCAVRVIGAFDKLQREFEQEIGKAALGEMLKALCKLEARVSHPSRKNKNAARVGHP